MKSPNDMLEESNSIYRIVNGVEGTFNLIDYKGNLVSEGITEDELVEYVQAVIEDEKDAQGE